MSEDLLIKKKEAINNIFNIQFRASHYVMYH